MRTALSVDVSKAATTAANVAMHEATQQADLLLGRRPAPGSPEWTAEQENDTATRRELAAQIIRFRIELEIGMDSLWTVIALRRWGVTWEVIAKAAGITRQAAHERWGKRVTQVLDRYGAGELGGPVADDEAALR